MSGCLQQDQAIKRRLVALHQPYPSLGLDRLYHLIRKELSCSRKRIHRLMNELHVFSLRRRAYKAAENFFSYLKYECVHLHRYFSIKILPSR